MESSIHFAEMLGIIFVASLAPFLAFHCFDSFIRLEVMILTLSTHMILRKPTAVAVLSRSKTVRGIASSATPPLHVLSDRLVYHHDRLLLRNEVLLEEELLIVSVVLLNDVVEIKLILAST